MSRKTVADFHVGQVVAAADFPDDLGQVERIDYDEEMVYVRFPTKNGHDTVDLDPGDVIAKETTE